MSGKRRNIHARRRELSPSAEPTDRTFDELSDLLNVHPVEEEESEGEDLFGDNLERYSSTSFYTVCNTLQLAFKQRLSPNS